MTHTSDTHHKIARPSSSEWSNGQSIIGPFRRRMALVTSAIGIVACVVFIFVNIARGSMIPLIFDVGMTLCLIGSFYVTWRRNLYWPNAVIGTLGMMALPALGEGQIQVFIWPFVLPIMIFFGMGLRLGSILNGLLLCSFAATALINPPTFVAPGIEWTLIVGFMLVVAFGYIYEHMRCGYEDALRRLSETDGLTGAWNRRRFDEVMRCEVERARRHNRPLSVLLFDVDHFKSVNDTFGHPTGDRVLRDIVSNARATLRVNDLLARLGGDEFAVLLPETSDNNAVDTACRRVADTIAKINLPDGRPVRVSIGATTLGPDDSPHTLFKRADQALYISKQNGRGRHHVLAAPLPAAACARKKTSVATRAVGSLDSAWGRWVGEVDTS